MSPHFFSRFVTVRIPSSCAHQSINEKANDSRWLQWTILSFALLYMAIDEASEIHELLQTPARWLIGRQNAKGVLTYAWVLFGITFILAFVLSYLKFFFSLLANTKTILCSRSRFS